MSYQEDTIDWQDVEDTDNWLDRNVGPLYQANPLGQDWARVAKVAEELGECVEALIGLTAQNPRKGFTHDREQFLAELADTAFTAIYALQHFTKDASESRRILINHQAKTRRRVRLGD